MLCCNTLEMSIVAPNPKTALNKRAKKLKVLFDILYLASTALITVKEIIHTAIKPVMTLMSVVSLPFWCR